MGVRVRVLRRLYAASLTSNVRRMTHHRRPLSIGDMAPGKGFSVTPPILSKAGDAAHGVGDRVGGHADQLTGATPRVIAANPGWDAAAGLQCCLTAWQDQLKALSADVHGIGNRLVRTAQSYTEAIAAEKKSAGRIDQLMRDFRSTGQHPGKRQ